MFVNTFDMLLYPITLECSQRDKGIIISLRACFGTQKRGTYFLLGISRHSFRPKMFQKGPYQFQPPYWGKEKVSKPCSFEVFWLRCCLATHMAMMSNLLKFNMGGYAPKNQGIKFREKFNACLTSKNPILPVM